MSDSLDMNTKSPTADNAGEFASEKVTLEQIDNVSDLDSASEAYKNAEKSLVRKLDYTLAPMVWVLYFFNYLDRNNLASARLNHFEKDLGLKGNQFNVAVSLLNVTYVLTQVPSQLLITRIRPSVYIAAWTALWSIISASTAAVTNYPQLLAVRLCLGIAEAPFFPGAMFLLSAYYTRRELAFRTAIFYSALILATAFSGLIAAGIFDGLDGAHGLTGWQWMFILEGALSFFASIVACFVLPNFPGSDSGSARWLLTDLERRISEDRIRRDRVSERPLNSSPWRGLHAAVADVRTWIFALMLLSNHSAYGFNNFFPTIVKGMDFGGTILTLCLTSPPYLLATAVALAVAWSSDRRHERGWHIAGPLSLSVIGFIVSIATLNKVARYVAAFLYVSGCYSSNALLLGWAGNALNQSPEKRACAYAIINVVAQLGNIWSPYFFPSDDGPRYVMAFILMLAFTVLAAACALVLKWSLVKANRKLRDDGATSFFTT